MNHPTSIRNSSRVLAVFIAVALALVVVGIALAAATVTIGVDPNPPHAIRIGTGVENYSWNIIFDTTPAYYVVHVVKPNAPDVVYKCSVYDNPASLNYPVATDVISGNLPGCYPGNPNVVYFRSDLGSAASPLAGADTWTPPSGIPEGIYQVHVDYYSDDNGLGLAESSAATTFWVANELGDLGMLKFHDVNGNGTQDTGESGLISWTLRYKVPTVFGGGLYPISTTLNGTYVITTVPAGLYTFAETLLTNWAKTTPIASPYTGSVTNTSMFTATFGNILKSNMACNLLHTAPLPQYNAGSQITYTLSYTKTGDDQGVSPVATLGFSPTILTWVSDTSGLGSAPTGSGSLTDPFRWTFPSNMAVLTQTNSFDVVLQFTTTPSTTLNATSAISTSYMSNVAGTNACSNPQGFTPTAVTFTDLAVHADAQNLTIPLIFVGAATLLMITFSVVITRRKKTA